MPIGKMPFRKLTADEYQAARRAIESDVVYAIHVVFISGDEVLRHIRIASCDARFRQLLEDAKEEVSWRIRITASDINDFEVQNPGQQ